MDLDTLIPNKIFRAHEIFSRRFKKDLALEKIEKMYKILNILIKNFAQQIYEIQLA